MQRAPCSLMSTCCPGFSCPEATSVPGSLCDNLMHMILGKMYFSSLSVLCYTDLHKIHVLQDDKAAEFSTVQKAF